MRNWTLAGAIVSAALTAAQAATGEVAPGAADAPSAASGSIESAFDARAQALPAMLREGADVTPSFTPAFLAAIPRAQVDMIMASLRAANGEPLRVERVLRTGPGSGTVVVAYDRATVSFGMAVDETGRIAGLRITDVVATGDSLVRVTEELAALPGRVGWGVYRLARNGEPTLLEGSRAGEHRAIGSAFKLAILGTLDAEIAAGRMRWSDVVALDRQSIPTSTILSWPSGSPVTLHSLATLMISVSDNRATDTLLHHLGRERIERFAAEHGGLSGPHAFPLLSTLEASVLKNAALGQARAAWLGGTPNERRAVLAQGARSWTPADVDLTVFARGPADIETIEWFASPDSLARLLGWFHAHASAEARAILAVNPGLPPSAAQPWSYAGYKGGSEPGVIALTYLLRGPDGEGYALAMAWNDPAAPVDEARFAGLAARIVTLIRTAPTEGASPAR